MVKDRITSISLLLHKHNSITGCRHIIDMPADSLYTVVLLCCSLVNLVNAINALHECYILQKGSFSHENSITDTSVEQ